MSDDEMRDEYDFSKGRRNPYARGRPFDPLQPDHHMVTSGLTCPACQKPFLVGQRPTLVAIGPGEDEEERQRAREGRPYNAIAVPAHWACVSGENDQPPGAT